MKVYVLKRDTMFLKAGREYVLHEGTLYSKEAWERKKNHTSGFFVQMIDGQELIRVKDIELDDWFELKETRWKPKDGEAYWWVDSCTALARTTSLPLASLEINAGNYFQTREQAAEAAKRVKATLLAYQEEINN